MKGSYLAEVRVHSYRNPSGRCDGCRVAGATIPGCCDEIPIRPITETCPALCDTSLDYCIRSLRDTSGVCPPDQTVLGQAFGGDRNSFNFRGDSFFGLPNPIVEFDTQAWRASACTACNCQI